MIRTLTALLALVATGCTAGVDRRDLDVDGTTRSYWVHELDNPPAGPLALVLFFHGGGPEAIDHSGRTMGRASGFNDMADREGFVAVYPDGYRAHWDDLRGVAPSHEDGIDDLAFVDAIVADVIGEFDIDSARIFATGPSNGGFFSQRLACERAQVFAAIAPVIAGMPIPLDTFCTPSEPVDVLLIAGTEDPLVPWEGGTVGRKRGETVGIEDSAQMWATFNGCAGAAADVELPDPEEDGMSSFRRTFEGCADGGRTELIGIRGGGHTWPGNPAFLIKSVVGEATIDFAAEEEIWAFFEAQEP